MVAVVADVAALLPQPRDMSEALASARDRRHEFAFHKLRGIRQMGRSLPGIENTIGDEKNEQGEPVGGAGGGCYVCLNLALKFLSSPTPGLKVSSIVTSLGAVRCWSYHVDYSTSLSYLVKEGWDRWSLI